MPVEGLAKIRHVGGWAIRKELERWRKYARTNMFSRNSETRQSVNAAHTKCELLDEYVVAQYSWLKDNSAYPGTLEVTEDRQYRERGLLHINDHTFVCFKRIEELRVAQLNIATISKSANKSEVVDQAIAQVMEDSTLVEKWSEIFQDVESDTEVLVKELLHGIVVRYMRMGTCQFLRDFRREFQLKKTAEHRKRVLQRQAIAAEKKEHLQFSKIISDRSEGKRTSNHHLCTYVTKHGVPGLKRVYLKGQLERLCRAYGVRVRASQNKQQLALSLATVLTSSESSATIPHPEYVSNMHAEAEVSDAGHVIVRITCRAN